MKNNTESKISPCALGLGENTKLYLPEFSLMIELGVPLDLASNLQSLKNQAGFVLQKPRRFNFLYRNIKPLEKRNIQTQTFIPERNYDLFFKEHSFLENKFKGIFEIQSIEGNIFYVAVFSLKKEKGFIFIPFESDGKTLKAVFEIHEYKYI